MHLEANGPEQIARFTDLINRHKPASVSGDLELKPDRDILLSIARSGLWPRAIDPDLIVGQNEEGKTTRAAAVLSDFVRLMPEKRFLDYGCGEGHTVVEAANRRCYAVGYDTTPQNWERIPAGTINLTTDLAVVRDNGPYDVALCYDVLDHVPEGQQAEILRNIGRLLKPDGRLRLRLHPFVSIHGTHLYETLNLAYAHLLFSVEEIEALGGKQEPVVRAMKPLYAYRDWIKAAGLQVKHEAIRRITPPPMFHDPLLVRAMIDSLYGPDDDMVRDLKTLHIILSTEYIDYELARA